MVILIIHDDHQVDLGVDPNKSTGVDLDIQSWAGSFMLGAVDPPSNLNQQIDFTSVVLD